MEGVRILEVAQFTFTPAAGAVLADWGADVIKVEHAVTGDAQRGMGGLSGWREGAFHPVIEHPNRGKRSIGLALEHPEALDVLYELARSSDVFLTNFLPDARTRLHIDVDDLRAVNPDIVYVRGSAFGVRGDESTRGGYDATAYLGAQRPRRRGAAARLRRRARHAGPRVRRLDRRDDDRGRDRGRAAGA